MTFADKLFTEKRAEINRKALRLANVYFLRYGCIPLHIKEIVRATARENLAYKYNHNHDPTNGQFTFGSGGVKPANYQPTNNSNWPKHGNSGLNIPAAVKALDENAEDSSTGHCAAYVRRAISAGGVTIKPPKSANAEDYGPSLEAVGFVRLAPTPNPDYSPQAGDVVVIQHYSPEDPAGHMAMFDGQHWVSDFVQNPNNIPSHNNIWPGGGYRQYQPSYAIYRP